MNRRVTGIAIAAITSSAACVVLTYRFPSSGWIGCVLLMGIAAVVGFFILIVRDIAVAADIALRAFFSARQKTDRHGYPACRACGYNLTGNTSGVCPECGSSISLPHEPPAAA